MIFLSRLDGEKKEKRSWILSSCHSHLKCLLQRDLLRRYHNSPKNYDFCGTLISSLLFRNALAFQLVQKKGTAVHSHQGIKFGLFFFCKKTKATCLNFKLLFCLCVCVCVASGAEDLPHVGSSCQFSFNLQRLRQNPAGETQQK